MGDMVPEVDMTGDKEEKKEEGDKAEGEKAADK